MFFALAIIIIGVILLLENLGVITGNIWGWVWPSLIILFGLSMFFKPWGKKIGWQYGPKPPRRSDGMEAKFSPKKDDVEEGEYEENK